MISSDESGPDLETEARKAEIQNMFIKSREDMGLEDIISFGGLYNEDSNSRAMLTPKDEVKFNEQHILSSTEELQRVTSHELQHVVFEREWLQHDDSTPLWAFVHHPSTEDLLQRMNNFYEQHLSEGYVFAKCMSTSRENVEDPESIAIDYDDPNEILALLRGYETYLSQVEVSGQVLDHEPYEFVGAFKPEDLKLLDRDYREELSQEVIAERPELIQPAGELIDDID